MISKEKRNERDVFLKFAPPGHFYSPIPSLAELEEKRDKLWGNIPKEIPGIELNIAGQLEMIDRFKEFHDERPFKKEKQEGLRYYYNNDFYPQGDGNALYCVTRYLQPKKIIEIGSGYSSALILDTNEKFFNNSIACTSIEPFTQRLMPLLKKTDLQKFELIQQNLQDVELDKFSQLQKDDILFIDSTHISKINSDVNYILFEILPFLSSGVWIHFHDIFYPFEYPLNWFQEGRAWNEIYLIRAFLQYNMTFKIRFFHHFLSQFYCDYFKRKLPGFGGGVNLWLEKQ